MSYASLERPDTEAEQLLGDLTIQALQQKAQALGVDEAALDAAGEKAELVALVGAAQAAQSGADEVTEQAATAINHFEQPRAKLEAARLEQLRTELEGTKLRAMQQRARQLGVDDAALGAVADKETLVQLVLDAIAELEAAGLEQLRTELEGTTLRELQKRAEKLAKSHSCRHPCRAGRLDEASLAAMDKDSVIQLILKAEPPVVCPNNPTEKADRWFTDRETGEPTLYFRAAQLSCWLNMPSDSRYLPATQPMQSVD